MRWRLVVAVVHTTEWRCVGPVATTTPAGLPGWGPRSARGSVIEWHLRITKFSILNTPNGSWGIFPSGLHSAGFANLEYPQR